MEQDDHETPVLFRRSRMREPEGTAAEITAVFPCEPHDMSGRTMTCYAHIGQHGSCSLDWLRRRTVPATSEEYADLKCELEQGFGYRLMVYRRITSDLRARFSAEVRRLNRRDMTV